MVLSQAEEEGYSVFCVRKATQGTKGEDSLEGVGWEDGGVGMLPESEADRIALVLGEPVSRTGATDLRSGTNIMAGGCEFPIKTPSLIQSWDTAGPRRTDCGHN